MALGLLRFAHWDAGTPLPYDQNDRNQSVILTLFARLLESRSAAKNVIVLQAKVLVAATKEWNRTRA